MPSIEVKPLQEDLPFGARVRGVTRAALTDEAIRTQINEVFERQGMIVFEEVEPTSQMQVLISEVFGPLKEHPVKMVERLDEDKLPGVITIRTERTPNPNSLKYNVGKVLIPGGSANFPTAESAGRSPLAKRMYSVAGVTGVFIGSDFITITKALPKTEG